MKEKSVKHWVRRLICYGIGMLVLTCGITLNTKTLLGVSPIISVPNSLSVLFGWDLGWVVTLFYLLCVAVQLPIKGRRFGILDVLQFPVSFLSGWLVGWYSKTLSFPNRHRRVHDGQHGAGTQPGGWPGGQHQPAQRQEHGSVQKPL